MKQREIAQEQAVQAHEAVKMRVAELEQFNELAVGRELRMIELKQEVNDYAAKCGHLPVYDVQFGSQEVAH